MEKYGNIKEIWRKIEVRWYKMELYRIWRNKIEINLKIEKKYPMK